MAPVMARATAKDGHPFDQQILTLLYQGGLSEARGLHTCVRLVAELRARAVPVRLLVIGTDMTEGYSRSLAHFAQELGVQDAVDLLGPKPFHELQQYMLSADIGLFLPDSTHDRYRRAEPVKYFEYALHCLPIIASDVPAIRRLVETAHNGILVEPADIEGMVAQTVDLLKDKTRRAQMAASGRKAISDLWSWEAAEEELFTFYRTIEQSAHSIGGVG
jgi:glycosyltransferase involved in cell wall biosynthesis